MQTDLSFIGAHLTDHVMSTITLVFGNLTLSAGILQRQQFVFEVSGQPSGKTEADTSPYQNYIRPGLTALLKI